MLLTVACAFIVCTILISALASLLTAVLLTKNPCLQLHVNTHLPKTLQFCKSPGKILNFHFCLTERYERYETRACNCTFTIRLNGEKLLGDVALRDSPREQKNFLILSALIPALKIGDVISLQLDSNQSESCEQEHDLHLLVEMSSLWRTEV